MTRAAVLHEVRATVPLAPLDLTTTDRAIRGSWYGGVVVPERVYP